MRVSVRSEHCVVSVCSKRMASDTDPGDRTTPDSTFFTFVEARETMLLIALVAGIVFCMLFCVCKKARYW